MFFKKLILILLSVTTHLKSNNDFLKFYYESNSEKIYSIFQKDKILGNKIYLILVNEKALYVSRYFVNIYTKKLGKKDLSFKAFGKKFNNVINIDDIYFAIESNTSFLFISGKNRNGKFLIRINEYGLDYAYGNEGMQYV